MEPDSPPKRPRGRPPGTKNGEGKGRTKPVPKGGPRGRKRRTKFLVKDKRRKNRNKKNPGQFLSCWNELLWDKILEVLLNGGTMTEAAREAGINIKTLTSWRIKGSREAKGRDLGAEVQKAIDLGVEMRADRIQHIHEEALESLQGDRADNARVQAYKIKAYVGKWQMERQFPHKFGGQTGSGVQVAIQCNIPIATLDDARKAKEIGMARGRDVVMIEGEVVQKEEVPVPDIGEG